MTPSALADLLAAWLPAQRWYAGSGTRVARAEITSDVTLATGDPELRHLIVDVTPGAAEGGPSGGGTDGGGTDDGAGAVSYQVLVGIRSRLPAGLAGARIGRLPDGRVAYDGTSDPQLTAVLLRGIAAQRRAGPLRFAAEPGARIEPGWPGRTLPPLQTNTSVVFGERAILKVLRRPFEGRHPDLEVPAALARLGSTLVAAPLGWIELAAGTVPSQRAARPSGARAAEPAILAILSEFVADATDGWSLATASLREPDPDFSGQARLLGEATARLHAELASAFGTRELTSGDLAELAAGLTAELERAIAAVPDLADHAAAVRSCYAEVASVRAPVPVQRVHGDYHLAQVLASKDGWIVLDFEGEPSVPLALRREHAPALRDVAGMLRSFDYAASHEMLQHPDDRRLAALAPGWARACQDAFCAGYAAAGGADPRENAVLLRALTLAKAVYEAVYEARHRPDWLPIPLAALARETSERARPPGGPADPVDRNEVTAIVEGRHHDPHAVLGAHPGDDGTTTIRALRPLAREVAVVLPGGARHPMRHVAEGVFSVTIPMVNATDYLIAARYEPDGPEVVTDDPYRHLPALGDLDLHLIAEGRHEELWRALGARVLPGQGGTAFAVWAPNATGVRVIGDFNHWDGRGHPMRSLGASGVWELFVPGVGTGTRYKYEIRSRDGTWHRKADPMAAYAEEPPATASVVFESRHSWGDAAWMARRRTADPLTMPMSIYEVHLGSWRPGLSYSQLAEELVPYVLERGFTHVEFLPVAEHPFGGSWGYQVTSYYAPSARFGTPDEFRALIDRLHRAGIGVILDWVPAHFPRDAWALASFDGTALYEHADPRRGAHPDWGTLIFDYGRSEVRNFLVANAVYWLEEFHADGLRVDAVASMLYLDYSRGPGEWTPNVLGGRENLDAVSFLQEVNATCYKRAPGIVMIAEESTAWPGVTRPVHLGGLGFGLKWNLGWMHDTLAYLSHDPVFRRYHHNELTFSMMYAYSENFVLPLSHDEVVHGKGSLLAKMPGDDWRKFATLRALLAYMWAHPGKQLLFMGSEFGQRGEWSQEHGLDWSALGGQAHAGVRRLVDDLNAAYRRLEALWREDFSPAGFSWIDANDAAGNVISFLRFAAAAPAVACVVNFSGTPHHDYRVGLPWPGRWHEVINTDAAEYGGSGVGNLGGVEAEPMPWHGRPASAALTLPPLGVLWLTAERD